MKCKPKIFNLNQFNNIFTFFFIDIKRNNLRLYNKEKVNYVRNFSLTIPDNIRLS